MAATGWLTPDDLTYGRGFDLPGVADVGAVEFKDDEYFYTIGQYTVEGPDGFIPTAVSGDEWDFHKLRLTMHFASASIPTGAIVTGLSFRAAIAATARGKNGEFISVVAADMQFVDEQLFFYGAETSGNVAAGQTFPYEHEPEEIQDGVDFLLREWGGSSDDWGSPGIPTTPAAYNGAGFTIIMVLANNGPYQLQAYLDLLQVKVHYQPSTAIVMTGSGTTTATVQRGKHITAALVGSGTTTSAANAVSQVRKITGHMVGSGVTNASVRLDDGGTIYVYGEAHMQGSGVSTAAVQRAIPIPAAFVGSGETAATVNRGIPFKAWNKFFVGDPTIGFPGAMIGSAITTAIVNRVQKITGHFVGSAVTVGLVNRIIKITGAFVGSATTTMAANALHQVRKIVGNFVGSGVTTLTGLFRIRPIVAALVGSGATTATMQRGIKITGHFVGSGVTVGDAYSASRAPAPPERTFVVPGPQTAFIVPAPPQTTFVVPS